MEFAREPYVLHVDYLSHLGSFDLYPYSGKLRPISNYKTLIEVYDMHTWIFVTVSAAAVCITIVAIDYCYAAWNNHKPENIVHRSISKYLWSMNEIKITLLQAYS